MKVSMFNLVFFLFVESLTAQVSLEWVSRYDGTTNGWDAGLAIIVNDSGNVYVSGASEGTSTTSAIIKYSQTGSELWVNRFAFTGADLALDNSNNLYVTGHLTIKMDSKGDTLWTREWPPFSGAKRIVIDKSGNIYLGGSIIDSSIDYGLEKITPDGSVNWTITYNGPANDNDQINDIVLDSKGNILVTGDSRGNGTDYDYATIKYSPYGDSLWVRRFNGLGSSTPSDHAFAITVDDSDNVYVTGWSDGLNDRPQCVTIKYSPEGDLIWSHRFPTGGTIEYAGYDIMHLRGFIYVVARAHFFNDTLLKYDLDGNLIWSRAFATVNVDTHNKILASDKYGDIYMTSGGGVSPGSDYIVLKYNPNGDLLWEYRYRAASNASSRVYALWVDSSLNVYLTGEATGAGTNFDIVTLKLSQDTTTSIQEIDLTPSEFKLFPAYPNPFNSSTNISFALPYSANIDLKIYNILGEEITTLISDYFEAGTHKVQWDAEILPSGMYLCKLQTENEQRVIKLLLMK